MEFLSLPKRVHKPTILIVGLASVFLLGYVDYATGKDLSFLVFYLFPIILVSWYVGRGNGFIVAALSGIVWFIVDVLSNSVYAYPVASYWNGSVKLGVFLIFAYITGELKKPSCAWKS